MSRKKFQFPSGEERRMEVIMRGRDTEGTSNGIHILTAVAREAAGNISLEVRFLYNDSKFPRNLPSS